ncbi:unnamed protein product [Rotaria sordida]|uniref:Uncharacterized protein n=1 Tax=Rotaria sordida TaxID=392033 RepID=A0A818FUZ3_9BILA|nr:unnamed protein product [Rotaria sordida]CAF0844169.1 unnamed protein product [Rotaria sordida]CAF3481557.1 unnamed protein product [Rotaria sordida]CAF3659373.1 unnamed protein product [Rotaria sordida]
MTSRSSSSSSSERTASTHDASEASRTRNTTYPTSMDEISRGQSISPDSSRKSPASSRKSPTLTGTQYDAVSIATTTDTGFTGNTRTTTNTGISQQQVVVDIPTVRSPILQTQLSGTTSDYVTQPTQPTVRLVDPQGRQNRVQFTQPTVGLTHPQYQPNVVQPGINHYGPSNIPSSGGSFSNAGNINLGNVTNQQGPHNPEYYYQHNLRAGVGNQIFGQQGFTPIYGPDDFKDVILNIDYGAMDAYNIGIQAHGGFTDGPIPRGLGIGGSVRGDAGKLVLGDFGGPVLGGVDVGGSVLGGANLGGSVLGGVGLGGSVLGDFGGSVLGDFGGSVLGNFGGPVLGDFGGPVLGDFGGPVLGGVDLGGSALGDFGGSELGDFGGSVLGDFGGSVLGDFGGSVLGNFGGPVLGDFGGPVLGGVHAGGPVLGDFGVGGPQVNVAKGGVQNFGQQSYSSNPTATATVINNGHNLNHSQGIQGFNPALANILQRSGLSSFI